jgi:hypothetical protein
VPKRRTTLPGAPAPPEGPPSIIVFVEIPEASVSTLDAALPANVQRRAERRPIAEMFVGGGGIEPRDMELLRRSTRKLNPKGLRVLRGRFPFGISEYLARLEDKREFHYITFLRDPLDRVIAQFQRGDEDTFEAAYQAGTIWDNLQTRMLSGSLEPYGDLTEELLEQAKHNLRDRFAFFGLVERPNESLVLARTKLDLSKQLYLTAPEPPTRPEADAGLRAKAERINHFDVELYRYAVELFDERASDLDVGVELAAVRAGRGDSGAAPMPAGFDGGETEWQMLIDARTAVLRLEWELGDEYHPKRAAAELAAAAEAAEEAAND